MMRYPLPINKTDVRLFYPLVQQELILERGEMRILRISINEWRHFTNLSLELSADQPLVCIVGANGTGKSHILELIASCAHRLGLAQGIEIPRGDPFADPHEFSLQFHLSKGTSEAIDAEISRFNGFENWDRTLVIDSRKQPGNSSTKISAGGIADQALSTEFASNVVASLSTSQNVHFLSLDADRAYPKKNIHVNEIAQAYEIDWGGAEYTRGRSFRSTTTLYDEWMKYFLAKENQSGTQLMQGMRRAKKLEVDPPAFEDHFESYSVSLQKVLPHIVFSGVDSKKRTLLFDTTGLELSFDQLSGGEREIAFLVGQIDRFGLRQGLFLLDEPELHLNSDLIRSWVSYLTSTVATGQIWLATHSLEAVEAAGQEATFVLERNIETRKVDSIARLDSRPVLSALSRSVGTPAFSISQLLFIFVEGEESVGERELFRKLSGELGHVRFMECGSCSEVERRVSAVKSLAEGAEAGIRIGGVVDRDFRGKGEVNDLMAQQILALPVHEQENFFLHPETLQLLLTQNGLDNIVATQIILEASDARAGAWIFQMAMATPNAKSLPEIAIAAKERAKSTRWNVFSEDTKKTLNEIVALSGLDDDAGHKFGQLLRIGVDVYARKRAESRLWAVCEGKQVLNEVARTAGFSGPQALISATFSAWSKEDAVLPSELLEFRSFLVGL